MAYIDHISVDSVQYDIKDAEAVSFEQEQTLTDAQQEQARANIGACSEADVADLKSQISNIEIATENDVGKALSPKTVTNGKVTEWQYKVIGGGGGSFDGTIILEANQEAVTLGEELAASVGWTLGTGWSGDFANGFTHTSGTDALEFSITGNESGKMYVVEFASTVDATNTNILVTIGDSPTFPLYGLPNPYKLGIISGGTSNLKFIPATGFDGTISAISIKEVVESKTPYLTVVDTNSQNTLEYRAGDKTSKNIYIGLDAGRNDASGFGNVGLGYGALKTNVGGFWNTAIGLDALRDNATGSRNIGIGYGALSQNISGHRNIGIGSFAMLNNKTGYCNIAIGADSLDECEQGYENIGIGFQALYKLSTGYGNVALGKGAGQKITTGNSNLVIGTNSLPSCQTGSNNIAIGASVMPTTTSSGNVAIGYGALYKNTNGGDNVAIGTNAASGSNNASQAQNVIVGALAGKNIYNGVTQNTLIGYNVAPTFKSGANNCIIGAGIDAPAASTANYTSINDQVKGSKVSGSEWTQVLGDFFVMGKDGVKRQIVFNSDNTVTWQIAN